MAQASAGEHAPGALADGEGGLQRLPGRILVCSHVIPPHGSGHGLALSRLLAPVDPRDYRLICFEDQPDGAYGAPGALPLPGRAFRHVSHWSPRGEQDGARNKMAFAGAASKEISRRARILAQTIEDEGCEALVVTTGTLPSLPAAPLAARMAGGPFIVLFWDFWRYQTDRPLQRRFTALAESRVLRQAAAVAVGNELLADAVRRYDGVEPWLMRIPSDDAALAGPRPAQRREPGAPFRIVYTGQVYWAMQDSIARLARLLEDPAFADVELHLYGPHSPEELARAGIEGRFQAHGWVNAPEVYQVHREADLLLLPLAFTGVVRDIIRTSSTTKLGDYLASGSPVLVNAPRESFANWFVRQHGCGVVVESPWPDALGRAVLAMRDDPALGERIARRGVEVARAEYAPAGSRRQFVRMVEAALAGQRGKGRP